MSMLAQAQTKAIGPCSYEVLPLMSRPSIVVMARMLKLAAPAFTSVTQLRNAAAATGTAIASAFDALDVTDILFLADEFCKVTHAHLSDGRKVSLADAAVFDEHFRGRFFDMLAWLRFATEVTYGPLDELPGKLMPVTPATRASATPVTPAAPSAG